MTNSSLLPVQKRLPIPTVSQLYSIDCYQRVSQRNLSCIPWEHLSSAVESASYCAAKYGSTDWQAVIDRCILSLSWDWHQLPDGEISIDISAGLRTNVLCVDAQGYDLPIAQSETLIAALIEGLNWQPYVINWQ